MFKYNLEITMRWKDLLPPGEWAAFDVTSWISRATLDAIGEG